MAPSAPSYVRRASPRLATIADAERCAVTIDRAATPSFRRRVLQRLSDAGSGAISTAIRAGVARDVDRVVRLDDRSVRRTMDIRR